MFKVGEVVVGQNFKVDLQYNGQDLVIHLPLGTYKTRSIQGFGLMRETGYIVKGPDGEEFFAAPENLRRKRPPAEYKGEKMIADLFKVRELQDA